MIINIVLIFKIINFLFFRINLIDYLNFFYFIDKLEFT